MRDAGIIGFVPRGEYSDTETYDFLQFVYYEGSTYVAKKETTGNAPAENNEFWQILASGHVGDYLPIKGGTLSNNKGDILYLENSSENAQSVSLRFKIPNHINNFVMVTAFDNGMIELWDSLNNVSLLKSSKDGILYRGKKLLVDGDISFQPGETFNVKSDTPLAGYVTTGSTAIFFTIPLPKSAEGRTISVSCNPWRVRGVQGYIVNQVNMGDYLITTPEVSGNLLKLHVRKKDLSEFDNAINNTPVAVDGAFTITFS